MNNLIVNDGDELVGEKNMAEQPMPRRQQIIRKTEASAQTEKRCPACGLREQIVWVHGHGQCLHCKRNIAPCCDGETC
jgi:hypothetical protein